MKVRELARLLNARALTGEAGMDNEIQSGYCCDLLSWVMAHGGEGMAWVTVQTHMNVIAVAALHDMSCVVIPEDAAMEEEVCQKAAEEGVAVLSSDKNAFEISGMMYKGGVPAGRQ